MKVEELRQSRETCTACAGTILLEFAALSRLSGEPIFERKAHASMDALWVRLDLQILSATWPNEIVLPIFSQKLRNRGSDLMGTVLNVHNGDWVRRDSGVGAGIDSYYEYCLKSYVLLGDGKYLARFNRHYSAVMKYISQGPMLLDVHMHRPHAKSRNFMDALLGMWTWIFFEKRSNNPSRFLQHSGRVYKYCRVIWSQLFRHTKCCTRSCKCIHSYRRRSHSIFKYDATMISDVSLENLFFFIFRPVLDTLGTASTSSGIHWIDLLPVQSYRWSLLFTSGEKSTANTTSKIISVSL